MRSRHLMTLRLATAAAQDIGATPRGTLSICPVTGGSFGGDRLRGRVRRQVTRTNKALLRGSCTCESQLGAIDFSRAVDAPIVTSLPNSEGTRGPDLVWRPDQARRWLAFTKAHGGTIAAAEYFNEPTLASMGGAPKGYDAAAFGRDFRVFDPFMRKEHPGTKLLAPGPVGEANADWGVANRGYGSQAVLPAAELAASTGDADAFSCHHYGAASQRCAAMGHQTTADQALSEEWLGRTDQTLAYYRTCHTAVYPPSTR